MESISIETSSILGNAESMDAVIAEVRKGLISRRKSLSPWLFYDDAGSALFERITTLPEYYVSRLERQILRDNVRSILGQVLTQPYAPVRIIELGAGSAETTSILLSEARTHSAGLTYVPIDISHAALEGALKSLEVDLPGVCVEPIVSNYVTNPIKLGRFSGITIALYIVQVLAASSHSTHAQFSAI
jgi:L-histidine Nalpha-methyltransferase